MTYLQAIYGSQYKEIAANGKDGNKGRLNGNILLSAIIFLILLDLLLFCIVTLAGFNRLLSENLTDVFGFLSGKTVGKLLAIPLFALIYFAVSNTVGSQKNFEATVAAFNQLPATEQDTANKKVLVPFFSLIIGLFILSMFGIS
jgi:hypothetical protein